MSDTPLIQRDLTFQFVLGKGTFGGTKSNTITLSGLRATVLISIVGAVAKTQASIRIYGMTASQMNELSTLGNVQTSWRYNSITVLAGNVDGTLSPIFSGTIWGAYGDYGQQPDVPFVIDANNSFLEALKPAPVTSIVGTTDVATVLKGLAELMGAQFENSGVTAQLHSSYYYGSAWDQARQIVGDARVEWNCSDNGLLAIWNPGQSRNTPTVPIIQPPPDGGMIGYPSFFSLGIEVKTLFNPLIQIGRNIIVRSSLFDSPGINTEMAIPKDRTWTVKFLQHNLEARTPNGLWETAIQAVPVGFVGAPTVASVR